MTTKFSKKLIKECYYFIDCPDDCTSPTHGICVIGNCKCNPGFVPSYEVWEGKKTLLRCRDPIKKSKCVGSR